MNNEVTSITCATAKALIPAYVLGTLEAHERRQVEALLPRCPTLRDEIAAYQQLTDAMLMMSAPVPPPPALGDKILAAARQYDGEQITRKMPPPPPQESIAPQRSFWRYVPHSVAAVLALILIGTNVYWAGQVKDLRNRPPEVVTITVTPEPISERLVFYQGEVGQNRVDIATENAPTASMVWANRTINNTWVGIFTTQGLNLPQSDDTYQLWLIRNDEAPLSVGIFNVDADGNGMIIFEVTEPVGSFDLVGVTLEPAGGSPAPTSDPILAAEI